MGYATTHLGWSSFYIRAMSLELCPSGLLTKFPVVSGGIE